MESNIAFQALLLVPEPLAQHLPTLIRDVAPESIGPQAMYNTIIERVNQCGSPDDWAAMLSYYGRAVVQQVVTSAPYLSDAAIAAVCQAFVPAPQLPSASNPFCKPSTRNHEPFP